MNPLGMPKGTPIARMTARRYADLVRILISGEPKTIKQLAADLGCQAQVVVRVINELHFVSRTRPRLARIAGWTDTSNSMSPRWQPLWTWGDGPDADRPKKRSHAEICRAYRERRKEQKLASAANAFLYGTAPAANDCTSI